MKNRCLNDNELMEYFYMDGEIEDIERYSLHLENCETCTRKLDEITEKTSAMEFDVPEGGDRALNRVLSSIGLSVNEKEPVKKSADTEIMTISEVADFLKVEEANVMNMLHNIPHFVFDGNIRIRREALLSFINNLESVSVSRTETVSSTFFLERDVI